jgi:serine-type D-Ala-D-Ala carboxypeptidase/endopeptidase (penicillin-binding protein 4)
MSGPECPVPWPVVSRRLVAVVAAILALFAGAIAMVVVTGVVGTGSAQPSSSPSVTAEQTSTASSPPTVLSAASGTPTPAAPPVADVLARPLGASALGDSVAVSVIDLSTGTTLFTDDADAALIPASTMKILTAAAALQVLGPQHRFATRVVAGDVPGQIVLVGGGDPMLTAGDREDRSAGTPLSTLADLTAAALTESGITTVDLVVDDGMFTGPAVNPDWRSNYVPSGVVGPVSALALDGGRITPGLSLRADDPALAAGGTFAEMLGTRGIVVRARPVRADAPARSDEVAAVRSVPLEQIVEHVLLVSDNDGAEVLARHVATGSGRPASFNAASRAVVDALEELGIDLSGVTVLDGSGLARENAVSPTVLVATLAVAAQPENPDLRAVLTGLPVAQFTGTLDDRFDSPRAADAAGFVRAKTGTLAGVSSLAGTVLARDGSAFGFAMLADEIVNTEAARLALDEAAAALAGCGCAHPGTGP